ncbi:MAG: hypothetical protein QM699_00055 [Amaricoccus sp.]|uniref:hypothetical protein n=1 Tax=Amaricoccus sp. TaxID=1872485 RepID=UPI0039E224FF
MSTPTVLAQGPPSPAGSAAGVAIGVILNQRIYAGVLENGKLSGELTVFPATPLPEDADDDMSLVEMHTEAIVEAICDSV